MERLTKILIVVVIVLVAGLGYWRFTFGNFFDKTAPPTKVLEN